VIGMMFLAAAQIASPPDATSEQQEIVVLAQKLKSTRFVWKASDKTGVWKLTTCKVRKSSGDKDVDAISCRAVADCLVAIPLGAKTLPPAFQECLGERRSKLIEALAARRTAALDAAQ
jgi:hypothetical protein